MRAGRRATLQDIADRLGISRSTASFALTGRGRVSDATRQRVREVAAELGYRPNVTARSLRGSRTGIVALHLPPATSAMAYYTEASFGIVDEANRVGRLVTLLPASFDIA